MPTNVPDIEFTQAGLVLPQEADILAGVQADMDAAFGGGLNPALETPQGQLATSLTAIIGDKNARFAQIVNQVDPDLASGRMQDAIGRIYFLERKPARSTAVVATCIGLAGTNIQVGARAQATDGNIYLCTQAGTIPSTGSIDLTFACAATGPIPCVAGSLNRIYQAIPGWDAVLNAGDGTVGANVESRSEFEERRRQSVSLNAKSSIQAIYANVLNVDGILDAYATENPTGLPKTINGYTLLPHSIYVAAIGGEAQDIARAIWEKKSNGSDYNGNTTVIVEDREGYNYPYPVYVAKFEIPSDLPVKFLVEIVDSPSLPSDIEALVKRAVVDAFNGVDGGVRARIGAMILASRYYTPISAVSSSVQLLSVLIGTSTATEVSVLIPINRRPTLDPADITVALL